MAAKVLRQGGKGQVKLKESRELYVLVLPLPVSGVFWGSASNFQFAQPIQEVAVLGLYFVWGKSSQPFNFPSQVYHSSPEKCGTDVRIHRGYVARKSQTTFDAKKIRGPFRQMVDFSRSRTGTNVIACRALKNPIT